MFDLIVVGSGPTGLMAAIIAAKNNKTVCLIEKNNKLGKKLLASGGGRCNITNLKPTNLLIKQYKNGKFLYDSFNNFSPQDIYNYFHNKLKVNLKEEDNNRIFPQSNKANDILLALIRELEKYKVRVLVNENLNEIICCNKKITAIKTNNKKLLTNNLLIATGGKSYPNLGTDGNCYNILEKLGHRITELYPTETPLVSNEKFIQNKILQGIAIEKVKIKIKNNKKSQVGNFIFTHFGISGSAVFRLSEQVYFALKKQKNVNVEIDFLPNYSEDKLSKLINENLNQLKVKIIPKRLFNYLVSSINIKLIKGHQISKKQINALIQQLKKFNIIITNTNGFKNAFVTGGGVSLANINPKNFTSKLIPNLYIAGEILDIHAHTGGYNITACLAMGFTVGNNV